MIRSLPTWPAACLRRVAPLLCCVTFGCGEPDPSPCCVAAAAAQPPEADPAGAAPAGVRSGTADDAADDSVFLVDVPWQDQRGAPRRLVEFAGKPVVISMIVTHCQYACPRLVVDMQKIEAGLDLADRDRVHFVLVSMDDVRDTPPQLTAFAAEYGLTALRWTLLHGSAGDVQLFNAVLGGRYKRTPSGDFAHSNLVVVLNPEGQIVHRQEGLDLAPNASLVVLKSLLATRPSTATDSAVR